MPPVNGNVREQVVQEMRAEIRTLADEGMSVEEIGRRVNGDHGLSEAEQGLIELLTYHAVTEAKDRD